MLPRHQPDPSSKTATRRERSPIAHLRNQRGGDDRANPGYLLQPTAFFARPMPSVDVLFDSSDLVRNRRVLARKDGQAQPRDRRDTIILLVDNDLEQFRRAIAALSREMMPSSARCPRIAFDSIVR